MTSGEKWMSRQLKLSVPDEEQLPQRVACSLKRNRLYVAPIKSLIIVTLLVR